MKQKLLLLAIIILAYSQNIFAQAPQAVPYQAVIRNANGNILPNQLVGVRFSIRDSIATGTILYQETYSIKTNSQGLINLNIGQGTIVTGTFASINWATNNKFIQTDIDITGEANYTSLGTTQFLSVPFALFSSKAGSIISSTNKGSDANTLLYLTNGF